MDNRKLGVMLMIACILLGFLLFSFNRQISQQAEANCACSEMQEDGFCPHEYQTPWQTYFGVGLISAIAALGAYLLFFEKSQKAIISTLEKQKEAQTEEEKFDILLKGLTEEEQRAMKAIREQDGITQQTLRLRTDMHKSKLSIILDGLEKKGIIKRVDSGKTKKIFIKIAL